MGEAIDAYAKELRLSKEIERRTLNGSSGMLKIRLFRTKGRDSGRSNVAATTRACRVADCEACWSAQIEGAAAQC